MFDIDSDMIREALTNLLSNAIRYTDSGHVINRFSDDTDAVISVSDDGVNLLLRTHSYGPSRILACRKP